mgnify:CR=1 FL=1
MLQMYILIIFLNAIPALNNWKDKCIELDYGLLTQVFGIPKKEIVFKEDVWVGYGAFGYSLEYFVRGLELGNAVFTEFEGNPGNYKPMNEKIIDMEIKKTGKLFFVFVNDF